MHEWRQAKHAAVLLKSDCTVPFGRITTDLTPGSILISLSMQSKYHTRGDTLLRTTKQSNHCMAKATEPSFPIESKHVSLRDKQEHTADARKNSYY